MKAATVALRDQIREVMRRTAEVLPVSTDQIAEQMAPITTVENCWRRDCDVNTRNNRYVIAEECDGVTHTWTRRRWGSDVYRHLRSMENQGLVQRVRLPDHRAVYWIWTGPVASHVDELEAAWSAS